MKKTWFNRVTFISTLALSVAFLEGIARAQGAAPLSSFFTPAYRGQTGTESAFWDDSSVAIHSAFTNALGPNNATYTAPGGLTLANAVVTQTTAGVPGPFIIPGASGDSGDIYSFSSVNTWMLNYSVSNPANFLNGVGDVVFQAETAGNELDYSSVVLSYTTSSGVQNLSATRNELFRGSALMDSSDVLSEWEWTLPAGDDVTSFSIVFNGSDLSVALERVMLDVAPVPEPGVLALAGLGLGLTCFHFRRRQSLR